jgi:hypothetical protein
VVYFYSDGVVYITTGGNKKVCDRRANLGLLQNPGHLLDQKGVSS